jgi:arylsulfatase A-like enzyme
MIRRKFIQQTGAISLLASTGKGAAHRQRRPNILILFADDLGYGDVGFNGSSEIPTPHIDSIAKNGVICTNGYSSCAVCGPSRAGLLSGRYQNRLGFEDNPGPFRQSEDTKIGFPLEQKTIADRLKALGYKTGMIGKQHDGIAPEYNPINRGFDEFYGFNNGATDYFKPSKLVRGLDPIQMEQDYITDAFGDEAVDFIRRHKDEPFLLYTAFNAPHGPMHAKDEHLEQFKHIKDLTRRKYASMVYSMDENIGKIISELKKQGLEEDTLIFFLSDNGGPKNIASSNGELRGQKGEFYDGGIHVPYVVQWKGKLPAGTTFSDPVISLDILPTAVTAAHGKISSEWKLDGVNLLPHLAGNRKNPPHEALYWRFLFQNCIRTPEWKLVKVKEKDGGKVRDWQLFKISEDPGEKQDVIRQYPEVAEKLLKKYDKWTTGLPAPQWGWQPTFCGKVHIDPKSTDKDW